jgi:hypothetical protein
MKNALQIRQKRICRYFGTYETDAYTGKQVCLLLGEPRLAQERTPKCFRELLLQIVLRILRPPAPRIIL